MHDDQEDSDSSSRARHHRKTTNKKQPEEHMSKVKGAGKDTREKTNEKHPHESKNNIESPTKKKTRERSEQEKYEESRNELKKILKMVPKRKKDIFAFEIDWDLIVNKDIIECKMHPWIKKKSNELFGNEEKVFIGTILTIFYAKKPIFPKKFIF